MDKVNRETDRNTEIERGWIGNRETDRQKGKKQKYKQTKLSDRRI